MSVCRQHRNTEKHRLQAGSSTSTDVKNSLTVVATVKKTWPGLERVNDGQGSGHLLAQRPVKASRLWAHETTENIIYHNFGERREVLEKSIVDEKCWREVLEKSVGEKSF